MRKRIVAGNWKMNKNVSEALELTREIKEKVNQTDIDGVQVILAPPALHIVSMQHELEGVEGVALAGQNCSDQPSGAFTGELSASMLNSAGASYVLVGHSERREYFGESNALLKKKVDIALENGLSPIYCCGEVLEQRKSGEYPDVIADQITSALFHLSEEQICKVVIAYEPVWAIGTGETASPEQAQEVHALIRQQLASKYGEGVAAAISILYGGSVKPANAKDLFSQSDIDGGLIGGASLKANDFMDIIKAY